MDCVNESARSVGTVRRIRAVSTSRRALKSLSAAAGFTVACGLSAQAFGDTLASFGFDTVGNHTSANVTGTSVGPFAADSGTFAATSLFTGMHANAATVFGNGSPISGNGASANNWTTGDYWQFTTNTTGYANLTLSFSQNGSNTGPREFELQYSTDGTSYTNFAGYNVGFNAAAAAGINHSFDLSSVAALDNLTTAYFRLTDYATDNVINNGGAPAVAGTDRIDNILISGLVPGGTSGILTFDPNETAGGGSTSRTFIADGATRNFIDSGNNTDVAFATGNTVNFTDANSGPGNVTIDAGGVAPAVVNVNAAGNYTFTGTGSIGITGASALTKSGAGTLFIQNTNSYAGTTTISGGTVSVTSDGALGISTITLNGGALQTTGAITESTGTTAVGAPVRVLTLGTAGGTIDLDGQAVTFGGRLTGTGPLAIVDSSGNGGALTFLASSTGAVGALTVSKGTSLTLLSQATTTPFLELGDSTTTPSTINGNIYFGETAAQASSAPTASNPVSFEFITGSTFTGTGSVVLAPKDLLEAYTTSSTGSFTGSENVNVVLTSDGTNGQTFEATKNVGLAIGGTITGSAGTNGMTIGGPPVLFATSGAIDTESFIGKVTLNGAASYSGPTTVVGGTFVVNNTLSSPVTVNATTVVSGVTSGPTSSTPVLAGKGTIVMPVVVNGNITGGSGATATDTTGALTTGTASLNSGGSYVVKLNLSAASPAAAGSGGSSTTPGTVNDDLILTGLSAPASSGFTISPIMLTGGITGSLYSFVIATDPAASGTGDFSNLAINQTGYSLTEAYVPSVGDELILDATGTGVPEPASVLMLTALASPLLLGRRRRRIAAANAVSTQSRTHFQTIPD